MPKRGQKMSQAQRDAISRAIKARNAKSQAAPVQAQAAPALEDIGGVQVEISGPPPDAAPRTLADKLKKMLQPAQVPQGQGQGRAKKESSEGNLLFSLLTPASALLAAGASSLWSADYRSCAPKKGEIEAFLTPLIRIISRRIEITNKLGPDGEDIVAMMNVSLMFMFRSILETLDIRDQIEKEAAVAYAEKITGVYTGTTRPAPGRPGTPGTQPSGYYQTETSGAVSGGPGNTQNGFSGGESQTDIASSETDASYARRVIAEAFNQDREYRAKFGLL